MKKILLILLASLALLNCPKAQTATTFVVQGDLDKYYPVTFNDANWYGNRATAIEIGRSSIHADGPMRGSLISRFTYHVTNWGNLSHFITADLYESTSMIAGWADATWGNGNSMIIIWLKGGNTSYVLTSESNVTPTVYDGVNNPLPYAQLNGGNHSYKTAAESYVVSNSHYLPGNLVVGVDAKVIGNVSIGTTPAFEKLAVAGNIGIKGNGANRYIITDEDQSGSTKLTMQAGAGSAGYGGAINLYGHSNTVRPGSVVIGLSAGAGISGSGNEARFTVNAQGLGEGNDLLTVLRSGNVGVGTTAPDEKLAVNGKIHAKEIRVDAAGLPDYVFEDQYSLLSLTEIEAYIRAHKHLPEVPSAAEAEKNGLELGEMNKLLLKKIEELTLHLIEKEKTIQQQETRLKAIEKLIYK